MKKLFDLFEFLNKGPLAEALTRDLIQLLQTSEIKKKTRILRPRQVSQRIYFIESGLFVCYLKRGDEKICKWFMREMDIMISARSFFRQIASRETIEALESSVVWWITYEDLQELYRKYPEFLRIGKWLTEEYYCRFDDTADDLRSKDSKEFYRDWMADNPGLAGRITETQLASYMGVTLKTLGEAKKKCAAEKNAKDVLE